MDVFYQNPWENWGCVGAGWAVVGLALFSGGATLLLLGLITRRWRRRAPTPEQARGRNIQLAILYGVAALLVILVLVQTLTDTTLHRASQAGGRLEFVYCDSLNARRESAWLSAVAGIAHVEYVSGPRNPEPRDLLLIRLSNGAEHRVPLTLDPAMTDPQALRSVAPPAALESWISALERRGKPIPDAYRALRRAP